MQAYWMKACATLNPWGLFTIFLQKLSSMPAWLIFSTMLAICTRQRIWSRITCEPDIFVWVALLGACRVHGEVEMGDCVAMTL